MWSDDKSKPQTENELCTGIQVFVAMFTRTCSLAAAVCLLPLTLNNVKLSFNLYSYLQSKVDCPISA